MKNARLLPLLALLCVGCGQKGPLYLPPPDPTPPPATNKTQKPATEANQTKPEQR